MKENKKEKKDKKKKDKKNTINEFKEFIFRGNILELAIGVIIGGAFGKIVTSLVNNIIMPAISLITGTIDLGSLKFQKQITDTMSIDLEYGAFLQTVVDFLIISIILFIVLKAMAKFNKKEETKEEAPAPSKEEVLLTEIRDILKEKNK